MLYTYPSNKLENLVSALDTLLNSIERPVLAADTILVQHPGMQHWLSMELAKRSKHQLCMNATYPLPVRYFWDLIRLILGPGVVPERSVYTREILAWRLYILLAKDSITTNPLCVEPTTYWQEQSTPLQARRRFQLAEQLADIYEQYLMFRPDWIEQWESTEAEHWQALLWQELVAEDPNHPLRLMKRATEHLHQPAQALPEHFFIFGVNTLAPIWLNFLSHLSSETKTDIHLLYLNPSAEHWDELQSEKRQVHALLTATPKQASQLRAPWLNPEDEDFWSAQAGNPLLTSLGQQGQAFVRLLSDHAHYDTHIFSQPEQQSLLSQLQNDLLLARDQRQDPKPRDPQTASNDSSLSVTSAHSAFREVQGLHDWLLHQFNNDPTLTPKDILVMCPNVEDYAPFVQAVFARSFAELPDELPPLPCSIADRNLKDADPTVAAFLELLTLPDARFEVNQILSWLRVPAIAHKFALTPDNLQAIGRWLSRASVHWGLSADHKTQWLETEPTSHFTWQQGLDRLLLGFAFGDEDTFVNDTALLHDVEGADAILLGKLAHIIEQLQHARSQLTKDRTPGEWQSYLMDQLQLALISSDQLFERSNQSLLKAINDFTEFAHKAGLSDTQLPLNVVRHVLENAFASPEQTGSQFMAGQITVCSMVPMRSIPFRVVAILGLNDGQFPRSRPPLGFDLMAQEKPRIGDRSRRGDDRYLFLEAILSARDALYLSYQGFDIHKNEEQPPSLVLEELFDYLNRAYGFDKTEDIRKLPLQPFSEKNYEGNYPSFDARWISDSNTEANVESEEETCSNQLNELQDIKKEWHLSEWVAFFTHPSKYFAQHRLGLYLEQRVRFPLEDTEPFVLTHLDRYQIQEQTIAATLADLELSEIVKERTLASEFPLNSLVDEQVTQWQAQATDFATTLEAFDAKDIENQHAIIPLEDCELTADLPKANNSVLTWRLANPKGKDIVQLWLNHLAANTTSPTTSVGLFRGKDDSIQKLSFDPTENAKSQLEAMFTLVKQGLKEPLFLNADLLLNPLAGKDEEKDFSSAWKDTFRERGFAYDEYIHYFWKQQPSFELTTQNMEALYEGLFKHVTLAPLEVQE